MTTTFPGIAEKPRLTIEPPGKWAAMNLSELWPYRDLLFTLAGRDIRLRYRQTALGVVWVLLQPLLAAGVFSFVFGMVAHLPSDGVPYFLFSYAGLLAWNVLSTSITKAGFCLVGNSSLLSKVYFPRLILPLSTLVSVLIDLAVALSLMGVLMLIYGIAPGPRLLLLPLWLLLVMLLATGVSLFASALMVRYRDVQYILPVLLQLWMYASPVAYATSLVRPDLRVFYLLNPMSGLLEAFRCSLLNVGQIPWAAISYSAAASAVAFLAGAYFFRAMERQFADVI